MLSKEKNVREDNTNRKAKTEEKRSMLRSKCWTVFASSSEGKIFQRRQKGAQSTIHREGELFTWKFLPQDAGEKPGPLDSARCSWDYCKREGEAELNKVHDLKVPVGSHFGWELQPGSFCVFKSCFPVQYTLRRPYKWMKIPQLSDFTNYLFSEFIKVGGNRNPAKI
uniref:Uncharacterized protein n=1 Tax=Pipistrellus kuhlii TaxID=59472 RepID=A0A7J7ZJF8_PIPKU|nr:hypothetical protein mPipKuh1_009612 [Pipistrellus kuhlii]